MHAGEIVRSLVISALGRIDETYEKVFTIKTRIMARYHAYPNRNYIEAGVYS